MQRLIPALALLIAGFAPAARSAEQAAWQQFRGPGGLAHATDAKSYPVEWSDEKNLAWKEELPGAGTSSPIVLNGLIYLTCYSGFAQDENDPGDQENLMRHVVCLDRKTGKQQWKKNFKPDLPESRYARNGARHGYSSSTIATDGERLFVFFGKSGVYCLNLDGSQFWHQKVGTRVAGWGSANSPVLYKDTVIVNASIESQRIVALDKSSGKQVWETSGIRGSWNTPVLVDVPKGGTELVVCIPQKILGIDPSTGKKLWECQGIPDRGYVCPSVVAHEGVVYAIGGRRNTAIAVRAGGRGDVTESHRLWDTNKGTNVTSPVYYDGYLYWVHEGRGVAYCLDAKTGKVIYQERLPGRTGLIYSSAMLADGKIYYHSQHNGVYVVAAGPEFKLIAHNQFKDNARSNVSPIPDDGQLLIRTDRFLYCVKKK